MSAAPAKPGLMFRLFVKLMVTTQGWLRMTCNHFIRRASDKYERRLTFGERIRQALHRGICSVCKMQERRMDQLRQVAHELGQEPGEPDESGTSAKPEQPHLSAEAVERIRTAMSRRGRD